MKKLFCVNFGAYKDGHCGEVHESEFYVDMTKSEILMLTKNKLCLKGIETYYDDNVTVGDIIEIKNIDQYYLHFVPTKRRRINIISDYHRLDLAEGIYQTDSLVV